MVLMLGYSFGHGDMAESLSLLLKLNEPGLLTNDFYTGSMVMHWLHERYLFVHLLSIGGDHIEMWALFLHLVFSLILLSGLYKICSLLIASRFLRWLAIYICIVLFNNINLGGNELYYNFWVPSLPAKALGAWGLYFYFTRRIAWSMLFISLGALFQPLVAAQLFLLQVGTDIIQILLRLKPKSPQNHIQYFASIPLLLYLFFIWQYHQANDTLSDTTYIAIIGLRMPHHFMPLQFSLYAYTAYSVLLIPALFWLYRYKISMALWMTLILFGIAVYSLLLWWGSSIGIQTQWFKTTIWLEFIVIAALVGWVNDRLAIKINMAYFFALLLTLLSLLVIYKVPPFQNKPYQFGESWKEIPEKSIFEAVIQTTDSTALFIIPPEMGDFRHMTQRSVFVDFKSIAHNKSYLKEWAKRVELIYGMSIEKGKPKGFEAIEYAQGHFKGLTKEDILKLKAQYGITHILTYEDHLLPFQVLARSTDHIIYEVSN
jgi:hypothetical protein